MAVPAIRIDVAVDVPLRRDGDFVLYWMTAHRRASWNFALDRAVELAVELHKPLVVLEPLRAGYQWASDRFHAFVMQGMADHAVAFSAEVTGSDAVAYHPYVEATPGAGQGLLAAYAKHACVVVGDEWPCFFHPRMVAAATKLLASHTVRYETVDSNGILPIRAAEGQVFLTAYSFRRALQKKLPTHLFQRPSSTPLLALKALKAVPAATLPAAITTQWPVATDLSGSVASLASLPIDHSVPPLALRGGDVAGAAHLADFLAERLTPYATDRSGPDVDGQSGLSPWLHWGQLSAHQVVDAVLRAEHFSPEKIPAKATGSREGWWGLSTSAEGFLDQVITWREIGFNSCHYRADYDQFSSLPQWAQDTLMEHSVDPRPHRYDLEDLDAARTHDDLWNAAQRQLVREGFIHNYLRMLWGKKILEWSSSPIQALHHLIHLNNRYSIDGRDPNSYSGIFWTLGRYDRPWGPKRNIFGSIRYMSSDNTKRKHKVVAYLKRFGDEDSPQQGALL